MFSIYSIGDASLLEQILIAVSMITGTGDFEQMVSIGLLIGALIISFQSLFQGAKSWDLHQVFISWIVYALAFGPSVTVTIEDAYDGSVHVVDNVPFGPAAVGSIVSNIGFGITQLFEVAYSPISPGITEKKFLSALETLTDLRSAQMQNVLWDALDEVNGGGMVDTKKSLLNYIADCTAIKFQLGFASESEINTQNWRQAIKFDSPIYGTELFLSPSGSTKPTCTDGWIQLEQAIENGFNGAKSQQVLQYLVGSLDPINATSDALAELNASSVASTEYIKTAVISPLFSRGMAQFYSSVNDPYAQTMLLQAESQQNTQWAAEQSLFTKSIRPLMSIIEGFVYAITPIAAFIMVIGSKGISLVAKYLQMLLWIQLWMPILSIINLYIYTKGQAVLEKYIANGTLTSMEGLIQSSMELERWISIGGMMAASTPALSFMLVSGSAVAFNSLAQRVSGGDTINEKMMSPDLLQRDAVINSQSGTTVSPHTGSYDQGAVFESIATGQQISAGAASAHQAQIASGTELTNALRSSVGNDIQNGQLGSFAKSVANNALASHSGIQGWVNNATKQLSEKYDIRQGHEEAVQQKLAAAAIGGVDAMKLAEMLFPHMRAKSIASKVIANQSQKAVAQGYDGITAFTNGTTSDGSSAVSLQGQLRGDLVSTNGDTRSVSKQELTDTVKGFSLDQREQAQLTRSYAEQAVDEGRFTQGQTTTDSTLRDKALAYKQSKQASDAYNETAQYLQQSGVTDTLKTNEVGQILSAGNAMSRAGMNRLSETFRAMTQNGGNEKLRNSFNSYMNRFKDQGMTNRQSQAAAYYMSMTNKSNFDNDRDYIQSTQTAINALNMARGHGSPQFSSPFANQGIEEQKLDDSKLRDHVTSRTTRPINTELIPQSREDLAINQQAVQNAHSGFLTQANHSGQSQEAQISNPAVERKMDDFVREQGSHFGFDRNNAALLSGNKDNSLAWLDNTANATLSAGGAAFKGFGAAFGAELAKLPQMTPQEQKAFSAKVDEYMKNNGMDSQGSWWSQMNAAAANAKLTTLGFLGDLIKGGPGGVEKPENMSYRDYAAYTLMAAGIGANQGIEAWQENYNQAKDNFYQSMYQQGLSEGLSPSEANFYAASHAIGFEGMLSGLLPDRAGGIDGRIASDRKINALNDMKMAYVPTVYNEQTGEMEKDKTAYRMETGSDGRERVVLNDQKLEDYTNMVARTIDDAADTGKWGGSYMTRIGEISTLRKSLY